MSYVNLDSCTENHKNRIIDEIFSAVNEIQQKYKIYGTLTIEMSQPVTVKMTNEDS